MFAPTSAGMTTRRLTKFSHSRHTRMLSEAIALLATIRGDLARAGIPAEAQLPTEIKQAHDAATQAAESLVNTEY